MEAKENPYLAHTKRGREPIRQKRINVNKDGGDSTHEAFGRSVPERTRTPLKRFKYGNYRNYYGYRNKSMGIDSRLQLLDPALFKHKRVLDIGCNSGILTIDVALYLQPRYILGVDIDADLIHAAIKEVRLVNSLLPPMHKRAEALDQLNTAHLVDIKSYFPKSMPAMFGTIYIDPTSNTTQFPHNIHFRHSGNWIEEEDEHEPYDILLALSISKWIHLNWGDQGIKDFFHKAYRSLQDGGMFVLEAQPWKNYKNAFSQSPELRENYKKLQFLPQEFEAYLLETVGFRYVEVLGASENAVEGFQRTMAIYFK
ncbi:hypothetical protein BZG36_01982 [Bifiguratus adelaidae]|uniref:RNA methyltransferase n=1 Tax=Bifiguratus adelaidae TaxID=1938954 RepID=A0A261Y498_9FUNG|nr:hypothetical protein BZG36_01982 [Bifiguratus adelaidae]